MKYKALESFAGRVNGYKGEIITISDKEIANDLLAAEYIEPVKTTTAKKSSKGEGLNEG